MIPPLQIDASDVTLIQYEIGGVAGLVGILLGTSLRNMALLNRIKSFLENQMGARL